MLNNRVLHRHHSFHHSSVGLSSTSSSRVTSNTDVSLLRSSQYSLNTCIDGNISLAVSCVVKVRNG